MKNKNFLIVGIITACILMIPLVAMQFTSDVQWSLSDFIFAAALLFGSGAAFVVVSKVSGSKQYRAATAMALLGAFTLIWISGAVGIIGSEDNPANLLYAGVLAIGFLGSIASRLRPLGMSYVLFVTAAYQFLVPVIALLIWRPEFSPGVAMVMILNGAWVVLFTGSGLLYRQAAGK